MVVATKRTLYMYTTAVYYSCIQYTQYNTWHYMYMYMYMYVSVYMYTVCGKQSDKFPDCAKDIHVHVHVYTHVH